MDDNPHMGKIKLTHYLCRCAKRDTGTYDLPEAKRRNEVLGRWRYEQIINEE